MMRSTTNKKFRQSSGWAISGLITAFFILVNLTGCSLGVQPVQKTQPTVNYFLPATPQSAQATQTPAPTEEQDLSKSQQTQASRCADRLTFVRDLTIQDGTVLAPDATLDKRWEVENSGDCNWDKGYRVRLIAGPGLGAKEEQALYPARSGTHGIIRIVFKAPLEPGTYWSAWQAYNPAGEPFGDPFFIDFAVQ